MADRSAWLRATRWGNKRLIDASVGRRLGVAGYRAAVNRQAPAGEQPELFGGRPVYVTPSTSGRNASSLLPALIEHLRNAGAVADRQIRP